MKIYENESYRRELQTEVTSCETVGGKTWLQLKDTIFFPEEGGQYADTGELKTGDTVVRILDGQIRDGEIFYQVDRPLGSGCPVEGTLDWEQRFMRMQQHTGEHILTGLIHHHFGYNNVGFHLSDESPVTLDLDGMLTAEQIARMELLANEMVYQNLPVTASYPSREELPDLTYRSKIEIEGQVRLITIGEPQNPVDVCACCAPHVARTGEVGLIKVISFQKYKGGIRLNILCGRRAFQYFQEQTEIMNRLARRFSTSMDRVMDCVEGQAKEIADLKCRVSAFAEKRLADQIAALPDSAHACLFVEEEISQVAAKNSFNAMTARFPGYVGLFLGTDEKGYRFQAGSAALDARELMEVMKERLDAKGGGSPRMVQGKTAAKKAEIADLFAELR